MNDLVKVNSSKMYLDKSCFTEIANLTSDKCGFEQPVVSTDEYYEEFYTIRTSFQVG